MNYFLYKMLVVYSPEMNPIELVFNKFKTELKKNN